MNLIWLSLLICGLLYSTAFFNAIIPVMAKRAYDEKIFYFICTTSFILQTVILGFCIYEKKSFPIANSYELFIDIAWLIMAIDLSFAKIFKIKLAAFFGAAISAVLIILPLCCPYFGFNQTVSQPTAISSFHAGLAGLSYSLMGIASIFAAMQIMQINSLQKKSHGILIRLMPSMAALEKFIYSFECAAALSMAVSVILGVIAAVSLEINSRFIIKFIAGFIVFALQISFIILRNKNIIRGKGAAMIAIILFVVSLLLIFPVEYRTFSK